MRRTIFAGLVCVLVSGCSAMSSESGSGRSGPDEGIAAHFGKDRAAFEQLLGAGANPQRDEYKPGETSFSYNWKGLEIALGVDDKTGHVKTLTLFKAGTWQTALGSLQLDASNVKVEDDGSGVVQIKGIRGANFANLYPHGGGTLTIWMPDATVAAPATASALSKTLTAGLRSVIGLKSDATIMQAMKKLSNGHADGWKFGMRDEGFTDLSFTIGNGGSEAMLASELGKLPVGIFYVGRGNKGKGPAFLKLSFLEPDDALDLVSAITGTPKAKLKFGALNKRKDRGQVRRIEGSKYVIEAVSWKGDPKTQTSQLVIGIRAESYETVTIS